MVEMDAMKREIFASVGGIKGVYLFWWGVVLF